MEMGLQPFCRGLYRLASRRSRTAAAFGSRVAFCGTQTSMKVRTDCSVSVFLATRTHLTCPQVRCVRCSLTFSDADALARTEEAVGHRAQRQLKRCFSSTKGPRKRAVPARTKLELTPKGHSLYSFRKEPNSAPCQASGCYEFTE